MKFSVVIFVVLQTLVQVRCEGKKGERERTGKDLHISEIRLDLEVNINVKFSNVETSSNGTFSKIICVLIKQGEQNTTSSVTTAPTSTTTPSPSWTTAQLINTTAQPFTTNSWSTNTTAGSSTWPSTTTDSWPFNDTNLTTTVPDMNTTATNPWWLDWWLQETTNPSIVENSTLSNGHF